MQNMMEAAKALAEINEAVEQAAQIAKAVDAFKNLSKALGIVGSIVGFIFKLFNNGPDPQILIL